jgi:hypothetical protein
MLTVYWNKGEGNAYFPLERLNLENIKAEGIYVIWRGGTPPRTVRAQRYDSEVLAYKNSGLYVTWAAVSEAQRDGVGKYLADWLLPLVGDAFPDVLPIEVNSPWG